MEKCKRKSLLQLLVHGVSVSYTLYQSDHVHVHVKSTVLPRLVNRLVSDRQTMDRQQTDNRHTAVHCLSAVWLLPVACLAIVCLSDMS